MTRGRIVLICTLIAVVGILGCGGTSSNNNSNHHNGTSIEFTRAALGSLPSIMSSETSGQGLTSKIGAVASALSTGTITDYQSLVYLFNFECHMGANANYCPPTITPTEEMTDPYKFTMGSLIGMIYHAQMYTGSLITACEGEGYTPVTVTVDSYAAASASEDADPMKFVLDNYSLYTCRSSHVSGENAQTRVLSTVADGSFQATLHTRYEYDAGDGRPQTDFFQVYVAMNGTSPTFLAFNFSAAEPHASRIVLLTDLVNHKFALKFYSPAQPDDNNPEMSSPPFYAVATGVGGYDLTTGNANPGYYHVTFANMGEASLCVNNEGGVIQADDTNCTDGSVPITWTSSDDIKAYLGIADADAARIAPFFAMFTDNSSLTADDAWVSVGDEDLYWPASLQ